MGGSEELSISWTTSDTATTIGDSLTAALNLLRFEPWGTWSNSTGTVTATANAKGAFIEDHSIRVVYSNQGGVYLGPGSLTFSSNPGADGSVVINVGTVTITTAIDHTVQTTADLIASAVGTQVNGADYPITAGTHSSGVLPIYFAPGKDYRRLSAKLVSITTTTIAMTGGGSAQSAGTYVYANTPGAGYPTLTTAIANARASGTFGKWVAAWSDPGGLAGGSPAAATPVGALFSAISTDGNGAPNQNRGQTLTVGSTGAEADAATFLTHTSPAMNVNQTNNNNGTRGAVVNFPDEPLPGYVLAAKVAALRAASDAFTVYDGEAITGTSDVPVILPSPMAIANYGDATQNQAIKDGITPLGVVGGSLVIIFGRTTLSTSDMDLWDWSWIDQADDHRRDLIAQAAPTFAGCALIPDGTLPASRRDVDPSAIAGFLQAMLRRWESQGTYVGAQALASQCAATINATNHARADAVYPESPKIPLHQIGFVAQRTSVPVTG